MKNYFLWSLGLFILVAIGALLCRKLSWYSEYWYADIILHTVSGLAFGVIWVGLNYKNKISSLLVLCVGTIGFSIFGSVLWEFLEFSLWKLNPSADYYYTPGLGDTLLDILCGAFGGIVACLLFKTKSFQKNYDK